MICLALLDGLAEDKGVPINVPSNLREKDDDEEQEIELDLMHRWVLTRKPEASENKSTHHVCNMDDQVAAEPNRELPDTLQSPRIPEDSDQYHDVRCN